MAPSTSKRRSFGCLYITGAVILLLVIGFAVADPEEVPREYLEPISSQEEIAQFAAQQLNRLQAQSFADGVEYCGMIYENREGELSSSKAFRGDNGSCDFEFEWGGELNPVASFHTHGGHDVDYDNEAPSVLDVQEDIRNQVDGYIATPGGRLWRVDWREEYAELVCGEKCLKQDPDYEPCDAYPVAERYTVKGLERRTENDPDQCR